MMIHANWIILFNFEIWLWEGPLKVQTLIDSKYMILKPKIEARGVFQSEKWMEFRCQIQFSNFWFLGRADLQICPYFDQGASILRIKSEFAFSFYQIIWILIRNCFFNNFGKLIFFNLLRPLPQSNFKIGQNHSFYMIHYLKDNLILGAWLENFLDRITLTRPPLPTDILIFH